jgi:hypothetical protein
LLSLPASDIIDSLPNAHPIVPALRSVRDVLAPRYQSDPGWFTNTPAGQASKVARWLFDNFFRDKPLPPPALVPFNGGQCQCDLYDIVTGVNYSDGTQTRGSRRLPGAILGLVPDPRPTTTQPAYVRWNLRHSVGCNGSVGSDSLVFAGEPNDGVPVLVSITKVSGADSCGTLAPRDRYTINPPKIDFNVNLPDIRFEPTANILIPVVVLRPEFNLSPNINFSPEFGFNMKIDLGGQIINFNGSDFSSPIDVDFSLVQNSINQSQINIQNSVSNAATNVTNNVNNVSNSNRSSINSNTNSTISNAITTINSSTNTSITASNTSINSAVTNSTAITSTNINNSTNAIINSISSSNVSLSAQLQAIASLVGIINVNAKLALEAALRLELRPDCPPPILPPGDPDTDDVVKPEEPKQGGNPKIQAVTIVLTQLPVKRQWGGDNQGNIPDKEIAGWFEWKYAGYGYSPLQQINFQKSTFVRPPNVSGYAYTLTNHAKGYAIEHTLRD